MQEESETQQPHCIDCGIPGLDSQLNTRIMSCAKNHRIYAMYEKYRAVECGEMLATKKKKCQSSRFITAELAPPCIRNASERTGEPHPQQQKVGVMRLGETTRVPIVWFAFQMDDKSARLMITGGNPRCIWWIGTKVVTSYPPFHPAEEDPTQFGRKADANRANRTFFHAFFYEAMTSRVASTRLNLGPVIMAQEATLH